MAIAWPVSAIASIIWLFGLQAILLGRQVNCAVELNPTILLSGLFDLEYYQSSPPYTSRCTGLLLIDIAWLAIAIATKPASHCLADHMAPVSCPHCRHGEQSISKSWRNQACLCPHCVLVRVHHCLHSACSLYYKAHIPALSNQAVGSSPGCCTPDAGSHHVQTRWMSSVTVCKFPVLKERGP
jgi:hypothetical protein